MHLIRETQCEVEVMKPVLDELEVMRLCHSFGMMSSVDETDFEFDILNAREFDEDFARFLRTDLFENKCPGEVRFKGLFGKQAQITVALADMKACSAEMLTSLSKLCEGVYCVKTKADVRSGTEVEDVGKLNETLVVFSWIRDELFKPQALRDTPTLVLRFLTVLTPDIICCTSTPDLEQLRVAMIDSEKPQVEDLSSYSVAFCIEKQEDAHDGTVCVARTSVNLHETLQDCSSMCLLKGSYPALAVLKTMKSEIRTESFQLTFRSSARLSFAAWLKAESDHYQIKLSRAIIRTPALCESLLREFHMWPETQVLESRKALDTLHRYEPTSKSKQLDEAIARQRGALKNISNSLFQLSRSSPECHPTQEGITHYVRFRAWALAEGVWKLDRDSRVIVDLPLRLGEIMQALWGLYSVDQDTDVARVLSMSPTSTKDHILAWIATHRARCHVPADTSSARWHSFVAKTAAPLSKIQKQWWLALESVVAAGKRAKWAKWKREQRRGTADVDEPTRRVVEMEMSRLCTRLLQRQGPVLSLSASVRKGSVVCSGIKEAPPASCEVQEVVKITRDDGRTTGTLEMLGQYERTADEAYVAMFTVKTRSAVQVCTSSEGMEVKVLSFPSFQPTDAVPRASVKTVRTFGKIASACDFESRTRSLAFLADESMAIYKFDEAFKQMDVMKTIDLSVHSTLPVLPFTDVFMLDPSVYVTDASGSTQRFNLTTDEIST
ncbi:hypothetical protein PsorP6_010915 [Peronosclerospora sorghi]|uniref:Uncharacterized protein n=1 Tax=Peronosclerospora sorghi TaxID=230839 RepID=A0ACC0VVU3_9STRA|nr:hypothetical protein PsorP6_010915 [Peronosclerospora sorghi]